MRCAICRNGTTQPGTTTVVLERGETTLIFKRAPVQVCENCGEEYLSSEVSKELLSRAGAEINRGALLELLNFAA